MKSAAYNHFPRVIAESRHFWLYNPILKKRYKNRPEERVRLKWVEYLLHQTDWKKSRIGFELPVSFLQGENILRADLVLYSKSMEPVVLVECKSDSVNLNQSTAEQAARYNREVHAPCVVLTNGIDDYWFELNENKISASDPIFDEFTSSENLRRDLNYWHERGFCSSQPDPGLSDHLSEILDAFWFDEDSGKRQFLDFQKTVLPVPMNHYYKVFEQGSELRLAVSFIGHGSADTFLVGILNENGKNRGVLAINLNSLYSGEDEGGFLIREGQSESISVQSYLPNDFFGFNADQIKNLPQIIMNFFE